MPGAVVVHGLAEIQRDIAMSDRLVSKALTEGLRLSAEPVAKLAEDLATSRIPRMKRSPEWAVTRIGVTRHAVYIVPKQRGVKSRHPFDSRRRPNLVALMMGRSYEPALERGAPVVEQYVSSLIGEVLREVNL